MIYLSIAFSQVKALDILMEHILTKTPMVPHAGSIYIKEGECFHISFPQNDILQDRLKPEEKLIYFSFYIEVNKESIAGDVPVTGEPLNIDDVYRIGTSLPYRSNEEIDQQSDYNASMLTFVMCF